MLPRDKERIDRKALLEGLRRGTAGALALILSAQLLFGNGSASAIAEELTSVADSVVSSQVSGSDDAAAQADEGAAPVDEGEAADSAGGDADEQQPAEGSSDEAGSDGSAAGDAAQDASGDEGSGEATSSGAEETSGQKADEQASADQKVADQDAAAEKSDEQKSAEQAEDETPAAARSWDDATDNLVLSTDGLALDEDAMGELAKQVSEYVAAVVSGERDEDAATYGVPATDAAGVELPESLPVILSVKATLDPTAASGRDGNAKHNILLAGDTFEVSLPEGVTADLGSDALRDVDGRKVLDVYQADADGNPTDTKVAEAVVGEGKLSFKLVGESLPASLNVSVKLDAKLDASKVADEASAIEWVLQEKAGRKAELSVPAKSELADRLGLVKTAEELGQVEEPVVDDSSEPKVVSEDASATDTPGDFNGSASFTTVFADNASSDRPGADALKGGYKLYFTVKNGDDEVVSKTEFSSTDANVYGKLGLTAEQAAAIGVSIDSTTSVGQYVASASSLPTKLTHKDGDATTDYTVSWVIEHDDVAIDGYRKLAKGDYDGAFDSTYYGDNANIDCYQLLTDVVFNVALLDGTLDVSELGTVDAWNASKFGPCSTITIEKNGDTVSTYTKDLLPNSTIEYNGSRTLAIKSSQPAYYPDNTVLDYKMTFDTNGLTVTKESDGTFDGYQVIYTNAGVPNHTSDTTAIYSGGSVSLTHYGTTAFSAVKYWYDENSTDRPATTYSLYRYNANGGSPSTAAQVADASGKYIEFTVKAEDNNKADSDGIDLSGYISGNGSLAKYDPDGNPYVYFLREDAVSGYKRVAGFITEAADSERSASISYNKAEYDAATLENGDWGKVQTNKYDADENNVYIYNRGAISNVRVGTVSAELTKEWNAGAYQDQLKNVTVVMQLKRRGVDSDGKIDGQGVDPETGLYAVTDEWENVGDPVELSGWSAGNMSQTVSASNQKYDMLGHEYVYQWCEVDVKQDGESKFSAYTEGDLAGITGTATLKLLDEQGLEDTVTFEGSYSAKKDGDAFTNKTITNSYVNDTYARVTKIWNVNGERVSDVKPGQKLEVKNSDGTTRFVTVPESLSITLYQDEAEYASGLTMTGVASSEWKEAEASDGTKFKYRESSPWTLDFDGLPKYDQNGSKYKYQTVEKVPSGFSASSTFKAYTDDYTFDRADGESGQRVINYNEITNSVGDGEGTLVRLAKEWYDGGNTTGRAGVTIQVYAATDVVTSGGKKIASKGDVLGAVELSDGNLWYGEVGISAGGGMYLAPGKSVPDGFTPGSGKGFYYGVREVSNDNYTVIGKSDATRDYADAALSPWADGTERLVTNKGTSDSAGGYVYDISYTVKRDLQGAKIVTQNTRVGLVNITLSKKWVDEGADTSKRPAAYYVLSGSATDGEQDTVFSADADGNVLATVPGSKVAYPLYIDAKHTQHLTVGMLSNQNGFSAELQIKITDENSDGFTVYGFPKYDDEGFAYSFSASEKVDSGTDYSQTGTSYSAEFDTYLQHNDQKTYGFTNARTGTKDVVFFTRWYDHYVKDTLNQRPDVYLTLYTIDADGKAQVVSGYESYKWSERDEWNGDSGLDQKYNQSASIKGLPKYDSNGKEIVYYATITPAVSDSTYKALDYIDIGYGTDKANNGNEKWDEHNADDSYLDGVASSVEIGGKTALREDGTFIFKLENKVTVHGTKVWSNLPTDYDAELPTVSIFLQRRLAKAGRALNEGWLGLDVSEASEGSGITGAGYDVAHYTYGSDTAAADGSVVAWTTLSGLTAKNKSQRFDMTVYGDNTNGASEDAAELPLYDADGNRYEYYSREIMDGLIQKDGNNPAGGFTLDELISIRDGENNCYSGPTIETSGIGASFRMTNTFKNSEQNGKITVFKTFSGRADGDKFPTITFTLSRRVETGDLDAEWTKVDAKTLDTSKLATNGTGSLDFTGLAIYAPNGQRYEYKVEEKSVNGYKTYAVKGSEVTESNEQRLDVDGLHAEKDGDQTNESMASFLNKYAPDNATVSGTKTWYDNSNIAGLRPDSITLTVKRSYDKNGKDTDASLSGGVVVLQNTDPNGANYLKWTYQKSDNIWSYSISNLEKWAPNGEAWYYTVSETKVEHYETSSLSGTVRADGATIVNFRNSCSTAIGFTKTWANDDADSNYQRPVVYLRLQARIKDDSDWQDAGELFNNNFGAKCDYEKFDDDSGASGYLLPGAGGGNNAKSTVAKFNPVTKGTYVQKVESIWRDLPAYGNLDGEKVEIEYRVIEIGYLYNQGSSTNKKYVSVSAPTTDTGAYGATQPYSAKQTGLTEVTNALDSTTATVSKAWDDSENKWDVRADSVTYYLRRSTDGGTTWAWVSEYGADVDDATATGSKANTYVLNASNKWSLTVKGLPRVDTDGKTYTYQFVEKVPSGYATSGQNVAVDGSNSGTYTGLVAVDAGTDGQEFDNVLDTTTINGTKKWETYGLDKPSPDKVNLVVTQYKGSSKTGTDVTWKATLTWTKPDSDTWEYTVTGLPKTAKDGTAYSYRVTEKAGSVDGFWPTNPSGNAAADASKADGTLVNGEILNTSTKFTFDKVDLASSKGGSGASSQQLNGVKFTVKNSNKVEVATWTRDVDGKVYASVTGGYGKASDDGYIIGLKAGTYTVSETQVPANHLRVSDFTLTIAADGSVSVKSSDASVSYADNTKTATVTVSDAVTRGQVSLTKTYKHGSTDVALSGMAFDLYKQVGDKADAANDVKVAEGITTDASGKWASKDSDIDIATDKGGASVLGQYYAKLSDGLPEGTYYFKETGESSLTVKSDATYSFTISEATSASPQVSVSAENTEFNASATLTKVDATDQSEVKGAVFELKYGNAVVASNLTSGMTYTLDTTDAKVESSSVSATDGVLTVNGLKKGTYTLREVSNTGYRVDTEKTYTLTVDEDDNGQTLNWVLGGKLENPRLTGTVSLVKKTSEDAALAGCTFQLQKKNADGSWSDVSGKSGQTVVDGKLSFGGLEWGTYRFVETAPAAGYLATDANGDAVTSGEVTISRDNVADSATADALTALDDPVVLTLRKLASDGSTVLKGAEFTVTPTGNSKFADGSADAVTLTTDDKGEASVSAKLIVGNTYEIEETKAPAGYALPSIAKVEITVAEDGSIKAADSSADLGTWALADGRTAAVTVKDAPIDLGLRKVDASDGAKGLAGAVFTVTPDEGSAFADGTTAAKTLKTNARGDAVAQSDADKLTAALVAGNTYVVTETTAPAGYALAGSAKVSVYADGTFTATEGGAAWGLDSGKLILTAKDTPVQINLQKKDADGGAALEGATFSIKKLAADGTESDVDVVMTGKDGKAQVIGSENAALTNSATYVISETAAPKGYTLSAEALYLDVDAYGAVTVNAKTTVAALAVWGFDDATATATLSDTKTTFFVQKVDSGAADSDALDLSGAEFTVTPATGTTFADGTTAPKTLATDKDGKTDSLTGVLVVGGSYTVAESKAPAGFAKAEGSITVSVGNDGQLSVVAASDGFSVLSGDGGIGVSVTDARTKFTINKTGLAPDGSKVPLKGVELSVKPAAGSAFADGTTAAKTFTTGDDGSCALSADLVAGNYYELTETRAADGYSMFTGTFTFQVSADGKKLEAVPGSSNVGNGSVSVSVDGTELDVVDNPIKVGIVKVSTAGGDPIPNAVFTLSEVGTDGKSTFLGTLTTGSGSVTTFGSELKVGGTYTVVETTAPDGYSLNTDVFTFTVNADGTVASAGDPVASYTAEKDEGLGYMVLTASDAPTELSVYKRDASGLTALTGAEFELTGVFAGSEGATVTETLKVEDATGSVALGSAKLIADGKTVYELRETKAPDGYELNGAVLRFTVGTDGKVSVAEAADGYSVDQTGIALIATDEPIRLGIAKYDAAEKGSEDRAALTGARFKVSGRFAGEKDVTDVEVDAAGFAQLAFAQGETYKLEETLAPEGYELVDGVLAFEVDAQGKASVVADETTMAEGAFALTGDSETFEVYDEALTVSVEKTDLAGNALTGAEYTLAGDFPGRSESELRGLSAADIAQVKLTAGKTYTLTETKAPAGYKLLGKAFSFTVNADGTVAGERVDADGTVEADGSVVKVADVDIALMLSKSGLAGTGVAAADGLTGAEYELSGTFLVDGELKGETVSIKSADDFAALRFVQGTAYEHVYTIRETRAPEGYVLDGSEARFYVNAQGEVVLVGKNDAYEADASKLTQYDAPLQITVVKTDAAGEELTGAEYTLKGEFIGTSKTELTDLSAEEVAKLHLKAGVSYELTETKAPAGYELFEGAYVFTLAEDGTIVGNADKTTTVAVTSADKTLTVVDEPTVIEFTKTNEDGTLVLSGAVLEVDGKFADGTTRQLLSTDSRGKAELAGLLVAGETYSLREIAAPYGYRNIEGQLNFSVNYDGTVTAESSTFSRGRYEIAEDGTGIIARDVIDDTLPDNDRRKRNEHDNGGNGGEEGGDVERKSSKYGRNGSGKYGRGSTPGTGDVALVGTGIMAVAGAGLVARSLRRRHDDE